MPAWLIALMVALAVGLSSATQAHAGDEIWTALVVASNVDHPKEPPVELMPIASKVQRVFGYNQVELVGLATKAIDENNEKWLVPSQNFWLSVKSTRADDDTYTLNLGIYQDKKCLVETQAKLRANSPLLIKGPMHARGQVIIVLKVDRKG